MFLTEYDQEKVLAQERRDTELITHRQVAADMLAENLPISLIVKISKLSEDAVRKIADKLGVNIN